MQWFTVRFIVSSSFVVAFGHNECATRATRHILCYFNQCKSLLRHDGGICYYYIVLSFSWTQNKVKTYSQAWFHNTPLASADIAMRSLIQKRKKISLRNICALLNLTDLQTLSHKPLLPVFPRPLTAASLTIWPSSGIHVLLLQHASSLIWPKPACAHCPERQ